MGAARRLVLGSAILGLFWSGLPRYGVATAENGQSSKACEPAPCTCDDYGRLTCDCKGQETDLVLSSEGETPLSPHTMRISVSNCPSVMLRNSSLSSMTGLRAVDLTRIGNLTLMTQSFRLARGTLRAQISIKDTRIETLPSFAFHGDVASMSFENVTIGRVNAFAFANLADTETLRLKDSRIESMEEQAFKKFDVSYLHVVGGSLGEEVPSRTMNDIEVATSFILDGVSMGTVRSSAFVIKRPKTVAIQNCVIENLEAEAFDVTARGAVIIKNNNFGTLGPGAFLGIRGDAEARPFAVAGSGRTSLPDMSFTNNSVVNFEEGSIMFDRSSFRPVLENVYVNRSCDCSQLALWKNNVLNYTNLYGRFYSNEMGALTGTVVQDLEPIEESPETFLCSDETRDNSATSFVEYEMKKCALGNSVMLFALLVVALVVVVALAIFCLVWCCRRRRENGPKRWISVPTSAPDVVTSKKNGHIGRDANSTGNHAPVDSRITMVVPDGRLYRETEFHVIVEKAEPLTTEL
ncbi:uncharacterized protein [Venturia canescens]|uniref:uncharacterized protein n=1 Tax=Venturia canescens TaxID=32260 RepID=UPI001C9D6565|nr:uncharacterized protein LOC122417360 [Venturia canescens]XP_043286742.1 uncharacterized protein LOC122417360 [Venturia canescens]XP_043286743.1 uncharacterized protein LOC122417360 [Venturia canescens]